LTSWLKYSYRHTQAIALSAAIGAIVLQAGCGKPAPPATEEAKPDAVAVETTRAEIRMMETTVTAQGTVSAGQGASARIASAIPGRLMSVTVKEGDTVSPGQVLAAVDNRPQKAQATSAAASALAAESQARSADLAAGAAATDQSNAVRLAQLGLSAARLDRDTAVQVAEAAVQSAEVDLAKTKAGPRPQEVAQAEQAVNQARATRDRAATEQERVRFLFEKGIDAKRQLDDAQTALTVADSALQSATQQLSLVRAGARPEDVRIAELKVQQARQGVTQARATGDAKTAQAQAALRQARQSAGQVTVKRQDARAMREQAAAKRADLAAAQSTAAYAEIRSSLRGIVTKRNLNPGDMADTTTPILEVAEVRALNVLGSMTAEDGQQVRAGMPAHITASDVPNRTFSGSVLNVGQVDPQTNLLSLRLSVSSARGALKPGTFASAEIVVRTNPRAVVVPKQAILTKDGKSVVFVVDHDNVAHQKEVVIGSEHEGLVEIVKGVSPSDTVIRLGQYEIADGAKVKPVEHKEAAAGDEKEAAK
jgi:RND family efflux transporter MFP subunit